MEVRHFSVGIRNDREEWNLGIVISRPSREIEYRLFIIYKIKERLETIAVVSNPIVQFMTYKKKKKKKRSILDTPILRSINVRNKIITFLISLCWKIPWRQFYQLLCHRWSFYAWRELQLPLQRRKFPSSTCVGN